MYIYCMYMCTYVYIRGGSSEGAEGGLPLQYFL